jgi:aldehyde dehydrogenase (NAD+)
MTPLNMRDISLDRDAFFVGGAWLPASAPTSTTEVLEAATGKVLGSVALAGTAEVDAAVGAAAEALHGPWGATSGAQRAQVMRAMATSLQARAKETAALVSRENGMPRRLSLGANGFFPSIALDYYAGLAAHVDDEDLRPAHFRRSVCAVNPSGWSRR